MAGKIAVISGGSGGLGLEIASCLLEKGRDVFILGRNEDKLGRALDRLKASFPDRNIRSMKCNIGSEEDVKKAGNFISGSGLEVEYLFNNAGKGLFADTKLTDKQMIDSVFEANLTGMILLTTEILRLTPGEQDLTIVNIMSTSALTGRPQETLYCAAKFGARGYTEALRNELKGTRRNVIAVYPGGMRTGFWNMPGQNKDLSGFMDPALVADKIVNAAILADKLLVTDITINRR